MCINSQPVITVQLTPPKASIFEAIKMAIDQANEPGSQVIITVDGHTVSVPAGSSIWDIAKTVDRQCEKRQQRRVRTVLSSLNPVITDD